MALNHTCIPNTWLEEMDTLTDEEYGRLVRWCQWYNITGEEREVVGNEKFFVKRCKNEQDRYISHYNDKVSKRSEAGKKGMQKRWHGDDNHDADVITNDNTVITNDNKNNQTKTKTKTKTNPPLIPPSGGDFEEFWKIYPKKVGKQAAKKAFEKAIKLVSVETLVSAVKRQECSRQWSKDNGQYIPNPATWLNQGRWEDELESDGSQNTSSSDGDISDYERMQKMLADMKKE